MGAESDVEYMEYLEYLYGYGDIAGAPRRRKLLAKTPLVSAVFVVCTALLLVSLLALHGLREMSGQKQTLMADLQEDVGPAGPLGTEDASDSSSASGYFGLPLETALECSGPWAPTFIALKTVFNARAR